MVNVSKLDKDRIDKLNNLSNSELTEYVEKLVLDACKGFTVSGIEDNAEMLDAIDKLDEITNISLKRNPNCNIKNVIIDKKLKYMGAVYLSTVCQFEHYKVGTVSNIKFAFDFVNLNVYYGILLQLLQVYYENYSNHAMIDDLFMDLSADGLVVDDSIRDKYVFGKKYGMNSKLMNNLDIGISVVVDSILEKIAELDDEYLVDNSAEINNLIDKIHANIRESYECYDDFEIFAFKQCGFFDVQLNIVKSVKNIDDNYSNYYLEFKEKIFDLIDGGDGFKDLSVNKFERYYKDDGVDFDEWMKKQPKYDVRNSKFICPEIW